MSGSDCDDCWPLSPPEEAPSDPLPTSVTDADIAVAALRSAPSPPPRSSPLDPSRFSLSPDACSALLLHGLAPVPITGNGACFFASVAACLRQKSKYASHPAAASPAAARAFLVAYVTQHKSAYRPILSQIVADGSVPTGSTGRPARLVADISALLEAFADPLVWADGALFLPALASAFDAHVVLFSRPQPPATDVSILAFPARSSPHPRPTLRLHYLGAHYEPILCIEPLSSDKTRAHDDAFEDTWRRYSETITIDAAFEAAWQEHACLPSDEAFAAAYAPLANSSGSVPSPSSFPFTSYADARSAVITRAAAAAASASRHNSALASSAAPGRPPCCPPATDPCRRCCADSPPPFRLPSAAPPPPPPSDDASACAAALLAATTTAARLPLPAACAALQPPPSPRPPLPTTTTTAAASTSGSAAWEAATATQKQQPGCVVGGYCPDTSCDLRRHFRKVVTQKQTPTSTSHYTHMAFPRVQAPFPSLQNYVSHRNTSSHNGTWADPFFPSPSSIPAPARAPRRRRDAAAPPSSSSPPLAPRPPPATLSSPAPPSARVPLPLLATATALPVDDGPPRSMTAAPSEADIALAASLDMALLSPPDGVRIWDTTPRRLNILFGSALRLLLRLLCKPAGTPDHQAGVNLSSLFARMIFSGIPRGTSLQICLRREKIISERLSRFSAGDWRRLLEEHLSRRPPPPPARPSSHASRQLHSTPEEEEGATNNPDSSATMDALRRLLSQSANKAETLCRLGELSRAAHTLAFPAAVAPPSATTAAALRRLHPPRGEPIPPNLLPPFSRPPPAIVLSTDNVLAAIKSSPKGAAGGCDGLTIDHLRYAAQDDILLLSELTAACNIVACGSLSPAAALVLGAGRLIALLKPNGAVRPICIPTFLRRLTGRAVCIAKHDEMAAALAPHQLGIAVRFGSEAVTRSVQTWLELHPTHAAVLVDVSNAFNSVSRACVFRALHARPEFHCLLPMVAAFYATEGDLWVRAPPPPPPTKGHPAATDAPPPSSPTPFSVSISSSEGTQQGDPLAGFLFALAIHDCLLRAATSVGHHTTASAAFAAFAAAAAPPPPTSVAAAATAAAPTAAAAPPGGLPLSTGLCLAIADDITLVGPDEVLARVLPALIADLAAVGCTVTMDNSAKTVALAPASSLIHLRAACPWLRCIDDSVDALARGTILLGVPLGTPEYSAHTAATIFIGNHASVGKCRTLLDAISSNFLGSKQCALLLLRKCAHPISVYWLRSLPPFFCTAPLSTLDSAILDCLGAILCVDSAVDPSSTSGQQCALRPRAGGLGLTRLAAVSAAAYTASVYDTQLLLLDICPALAHALAAAIPSAMVGAAAAAEAEAATAAAAEPFDPNAIPLAPPTQPPPPPHLIPLALHLHAAVASLPAASRRLLDTLPTDAATAAAAVAAAATNDRRTAGRQRKLMEPIHKALTDSFDASISPAVIAAAAAAAASSSPPASPPPAAAPPPPSSSGRSPNPPSVAARAARNVAAAAAARHLARVLSLRGGGMGFLEALPTQHHTLTNADIVYFLCPALGIPLSQLAAARPSSRGPLRCCGPGCSSTIDPVHPSSHLSGQCFRGLWTERHNLVQNYGVVPIFKQFAGRPHVQTNVQGFPAGMETDVLLRLTDGLAAQLPILTDVVIADPTLPSYAARSAAAAGHTAADRHNFKLKTYGLLPGLTPKIDVNQYEFVAWAVETYGRTTPEVRAFLYRQALRCAELEGGGGPQFSAELELQRVEAVAQSLLAAWLRLHSCAVVRAHARFLHSALHLCCAAEADADPPDDELFPGSAAAAHAAPAAYADLPRRASARDAFSLRLPRHAAST